MIKNLEELFESNWDELKGNIKKQWGKLTHQDIKQIEGSYDILVAKLKKIYGYSRQEIEDEINSFLSSEGIEEIQNTVSHFKDEAQDWALSLKDKVVEYMQNYWEELKEKSLTLERNALCYIKENPMKIFWGVAVLSFACAKLWPSKNNENVENDEKIMKM